MFFFSVFKRTMNKPTCCDHNHTVEDVQSLQCLNYTKEWSPSDEALFSTYFKGPFDSVDIYLKICTLKMWIGTSCDYVELPSILLFNRCVASWLTL